ncbi:MAG: hypothetical protein CK427_07095 [Leptospira sp.]|nr:MAG: hypothetical protein CK427_07095 [Leptospira sp.]
MTKIKIITGFGIYLWAFSIFAHGENQIGQNGGKIRMPGAYHTEVLDYQGKGFKIYLLDISFKNPYTMNSKVNAKIISSKSEKVLKCYSHPDHFYCKGSSSEIDQEGILEIISERNGSKGMAVKYNLPIKEN